MKLLHAPLSLCLLALVVHGEEDVSGSPPPARITGEARLLGGVADGTPPPPRIPPELPDFAVEDSAVRQLPDRKVTVHRVEDPGLPPRPAPPEPLTAEEREALHQTPEYQAYLAEGRERALKARFAMVSATVHDREKTRISWWIPGDREQNLEPRSFEAWSNVDFFHLGGFGSFEYDGFKYLLIMGLGAVDTETLQERRELAARFGVEIEIPESPELPTDQPAYIVTKGDPTDAEGVALMDGLHALYAKERDRLVAAYESREQARIEREARLKANPPKPKDLILHFWHGKRTQRQQKDSK